tara:strand:+ start:6559 stop:6744 length:186 start_codon:yes stop_codon:yes gene_type:complete
MNTYLVKSSTNYGEVAHVVNAIDEADVRIIVLNDSSVWSGYEIELINTTKRGLVSIVGGCS